MTSRMPERARTDPREPWGSNPLGPPGPFPFLLPSDPARLAVQRLPDEHGRAETGAQLESITSPKTSVIYRRFSRPLNLPIAHPIFSADRPVFPGFFGL